MALPEREVLRYLGFRGHAADAETQRRIAEVGAALEAAVTPKSVWRRYPIRVAEGVVEIDGETVRSVKLARHLRGCSAAYLFAATLGAAADGFLRRLSVTDMASAAVGQACCAAYIEQYCDEMQARLAAEEAACGLYLKPRFSPGYGDFSLAFQRALFARLQPEKHIGLTLTESLLMVPIKSVSAVIGVSASPACSYRKCAGCENTACAFRTEGEN